MKADDLKSEGLAQVVGHERSHWLSIVGRDNSGKKWN